MEISMEREPADVYRRYERHFPLCSPDDVDDAQSAATIATLYAVRAAREPVHDAPAFEYRVMSRYLMRVSKRKRKHVYPDASDDESGWAQVEESLARQHSISTENTMEDHLETEGVLRRLPSHYAQVLNLHYLEGLTLEEAARRIGVSGMCMRKRHERALKLARRVLGIERAMMPRG